MSDFQRRVYARCRRAMRYRRNGVKVLIFGRIRWYGCYRLMVFVEPIAEDGASDARHVGCGFVDHSVITQRCETFINRERFGNFGAELTHSNRFLGENLLNRAPVRSKVV